MTEIKIILMIDNYDSFTWNVYQEISKLLSRNGLIDFIVKRNDQISLLQAIEMNPEKLIISPGPGYPSSAGVSMEFIEYFAGKIPILGVCLGEQCMFELYGGKVVPCGELVHGKTTPVEHDGKGLFYGLDQNIECTRYHSLAGDANTLPDELVITSWTASGIVMGVRHKKYVMEGVQFHPESIASEQGRLIFANFLSWNGGLWDDLVITPINLEQTNDKELLKEQEMKMVGKGIPLHKATKMNSTSRQINVISTNENESSQSSILQKIFTQRRIDVAQEKLMLGGSMAYMERCFALNIAPNLIDFKKRLQSSINSQGIAILAEIKRASPSKGDIDSLVHAPQQALLYAQGGAAAISVLTESKWFKGTIEDLRNIRLAVESVTDRPAILRKEFIFDPYQILQARLAGADTILLIVAMLTDTILSSLIEYSRSLGMEPLVEVASVSEMKRALALNAQVIGVNNRDLNTFTVDMNRTTALSGMVSENIILLALSGIKNRNDVEGYLNNGVKGVLVGESLMKSNDKIQAVRDLITNPKNIENNLKAEIVLKPKKTMVKICGLTNILDAKAAVSHGADILGFIFARNSPRYVDKETVKQIINTIQPNAEQIHHLFSNSFLTPPASAKEWFSSQNLPSKRPLFIGVFTCQSAHEINQITAECNLDLIQLHTPRSPSFHRLLNRPVVQVLGISTSTTLTNLETFAKQCAGSCTALLLDTTTPQVVGGSGETFDWALATKLKLPVWLAGGLKAENVKESCRIGNPLVVDVCSGVELDGKKGQKDSDKLKRFIQAVDSWNQSI